MLVASDLMTTKDVADRLGVTDRTMRYWRRAGHMPPPLRTAPHCLWLRETVEAWLPKARQMMARNQANRLARLVPGAFHRRAKGAAP